MNNEKLEMANRLNNRLKVLYEKRDALKALKSSKRQINLTNYNNCFELSIIENESLKDTILLMLSSALEEKIKAVEKEFEEL